MCILSSIYYCNQHHTGLPRVICKYTTWNNDRKIKKRPKANVSKHDGQKNSTVNVFFIAGKAESIIIRAFRR